MIETWSTGDADENMAEDILVEQAGLIRRHPWWRARSRLTLEILVRMGVRPPDRVLDAGCGWGTTLEALEDRGFHAVGMDISRRGLEMLDRERPGRTLVEADLTRPLPPGLETFGAVLALDVIEHLDDDRDAVARLGELASAGAVVVVSVPALPEMFTEFDRIQGHRRRYTPEMLRAAFEGSGLEVERVFFWGSWLVPALRRQRRKPLRAEPGESVSRTYSRYLRLPPWPVPLALRGMFALERDRSIDGKLTTGTSLFAVARRTARSGDGGVARSARDRRREEIASPFQFPPPWLLSQGWLIQTAPSGCANGFRHRVEVVQEGTISRRVGLALPRPGSRQGKPYPTEKPESVGGPELSQSGFPPNGQMLTIGGEIGPVTDLTEPSPAMQIILANPRGFCAGVNMAIESLERSLDFFGAPVFVYHEIVHNKYVVERFRSRGVVFVESIEEVPEGAPLLYSAHGVSPQIREEARTTEAPRDRRDLPAGDEGPPRSRQVRQRRVHDHPDRPRRARRGHRHDGRGPRADDPGRDGRGRRGARSAHIDQGRLSDPDDPERRRRQHRDRGPPEEVPADRQPAQGRHLLRDAEPPGGRPRAGRPGRRRAGPGQSEQLEQQAAGRDRPVARAARPPDRRRRRPPVRVVRGGRDRPDHRRRQRPEDVVQECIGYLQTRFGATIVEEWVREESVHFPLPKSLRELLPPASPSGAALRA